jgi:acetyl-CoA synthetase
VTSPDDRVVDLLGIFGHPGACAAELLCDRHPAAAVAFTVVEPDLTVREVTFGELRDSSARLATALAGLGVGRGDRVATLMGKSAELVISLLAIWRLGAVQVPLFTAFAPQAIATRISGNGTKAVITDPAQRAKLDKGDDFPARAGWRVVTTGAPAGDDLGFQDMLTASPQRTPVATGGESFIIELFTSGTSGPPKGVLVPLKAVASMHMYQEYGLDHQSPDVFWNAADPGWAYGLYHAIVGPLALGRPSMLLRGGFSPELTWSVLSKFGVTNFAAGPTAYRALRNAMPADAVGLQLRHCSSAGEPLDPEVSSWAEKAFGVAVLDHYGQTELGMVAANPWHPDVRGEVRPGFMGRALPGWQLDVLKADADESSPPGEPGRLAVDLASSPLMWFTGYRDAPERTAERFTADRLRYLTGDTATKDAEGYFAFTGREDDVILMAGYRIGPSEVESTLMQHDHVSEAAVVAAPDDLRGEVLVAYVVLRPGTQPDDDLIRELQQLVKQRYAAHAYPRNVHFVAALPRTASGKLQRFLLRKAPYKAPGSSGEPSRLVEGNPDRREQ